MKTRTIAIRVVIFGGLAAAAVPRLGADQGAATKGDEFTTTRESDADANALARIHAEKRKRIEERWAEAGGALTASAIAIAEEATAGAAKPAGVSTIDGVVVAEEPNPSPVQITPAESGTPKLEPFATIEVGPSGLSASESEKAERLLPGIR